MLYCCSIVLRSLVDDMDLDPTSVILLNLVFDIFFSFLWPLFLLTGVAVCACLCRLPFSVILFIGLARSH